MLIDLSDGEEVTICYKEVCTTINSEMLDKRIR